MTTIIEQVKIFESGESCDEYAELFIEEAKKINKRFHYFAEFCNKSSKRGGELSGIPVTIKDCICVKGVQSRASSAILNNYNPVFNASSVQKTINEGATITGKTVQDEFGFGGFSVNVGIGFEIPRNPHDEDRVCGGSSGGSAGITAATKHAHLSIGESTGGSIVTPASFCGVVGICPTYGLVSRYGLMDYANSLDKIGPFTKTVLEGAVALKVLAGHDTKDSTSTNKKVPDYTKIAGKNIKGWKIGYMDPEGVEEPIRKNLHESMQKIKESGAKTEKITMPVSDEYAIPAYYTIALCEASTNLAKYCGLRYGAQEEPKGFFDEYFSNIRSKNFGKEAKRRILLGTFARQAGFRDSFYIKALQARTHIINEYKKIFSEVDAIITPTMPILPPLIKRASELTPLQSYLSDKLTVGPNIAGLPHMSLPTGKHKSLPIGLMITANHYEEEKMMTLGKELEEKNE